MITMTGRAIRLDGADQRESIRSEKGNQCRVRIKLVAEDLTDAELGQLEYSKGAVGLHADGKAKVADEGPKSAELSWRQAGSHEYELGVIRDDGDQSLMTFTGRIAPKPRLKEVEGKPALFWKVDAELPVDQLGILGTWGNSDNTVLTVRGSKPKPKTDDNQPELSI